MEERDWEAVKRSGCIGVFVGAEAAGPETLEKIRKPVTTGEVEECARLCEKYGIAANFNYIIGFPGESEESIQATLRQVRILKRKHPRVSIPTNTFWPLPGTELYPQAIKMGYQPPETLEAFANISDWRTNLYPIADRFRRKLSLMEVYQYWGYYAEIGGGVGGLFKRCLRWAGLLRYRIGFFSWPIELLAFEYTRNFYHRLRRLVSTS
jgi:hypothetical protein